MEYSELSDEEEELGPKKVRKLYYHNLFPQMRGFLISLFLIWLPYFWKLCIWVPNLHHLILSDLPNALWIHDITPLILQDL